MVLYSSRVTIGQSLCNGYRRNAALAILAKGFESLIFAVIIYWGKKIKNSGS